MALTSLCFFKRNNIAGRSGLFGQRYKKAGPFPFFALGRYLAPMILHNHSANKEPKPGADFLACFMAGKVALKQVGKDILGKPGAVISNNQGDGTAVILGADDNCFVLPYIFNRIVYKVNKHAV